jgi:Rhodopirellula transposase DDE domain
VNLISLLIIRELVGHSVYVAVKSWEEPSERVRRPGAGCKTTVSKDPTLVRDLEALVEPTTRGDPGSPLRWTCKSVRRLAQALQAQGPA